MELPTNWAATTVCSAVFVAGLPLEVALAEDCDFPCELLVNVTVDYAERSVTARMRRTEAHLFKSIWRGDGVGCTVIDGISEEELRAQDVGDQTPLPPLNATEPWPLGDLVDTEGARDDDVDWEQVEATVEDTFACEGCNTRAVVVVHRGKVVLERYKDGVTPQTRLLGWSASKSVTNAFVGLLVGEGRLNLSAPAPVPEWRADPDDPRGAITLDQMMHMEAGLLWRELPGDVACLFTQGNGDCAGWYANQPVEDPPGSRFEYSSGLTYLIMRTVLQQRGDPQWTNFEWARQRLFRRLAMHSALIEPEANGYLAGGSLAYMTARDWSRFGLLYLRDGVWVDGTRILPEGWVEYTSTPTAISGNAYGAQFWYLSVPVPNFRADGFRRQNVFVVPSKDLVIARFAMPSLRREGRTAFDLLGFLTGIVEAFP